VSTASPLCTVSEERALVPLELKGELGPRYFGPLWTTLLAATGVLLVLRVARLLARWFLRRHVTALVTLHEPGLHLSLRTTMFGKLLGERELLIALHDLNRVERVVRYAGLAFYAGLCALALGSYVGAQLIVESVRGGQDTLILLVLGPLVIGLGLLLDFILVTGLGSVRGLCRLRLVTRDGLRLEIDQLDPPLVDALLRGLKARLSQAALEPPTAQAA